MIGKTLLMITGRNEDLDKIISEENLGKEETHK